MPSTRTAYGLVVGETPPALHRLGTIARRSCCGKAIVPVPRERRSGLVVCRRCVAIDQARRDGMPEWD